MQSIMQDPVHSCGVSIDATAIDVMICSFFLIHGLVEECSPVRVINVHINCSFFLTPPQC